MGADLCGYIFFGPKELDKAKIAKARKWLEKVVHQAQQLVEINSGAIVEINNSDAEQFKEIRQLLKNKEICLEFSGGCDLVDSLAESGDLLEKFLDVWDCAYRDQMSRFVPKRFERVAKGWRVVVCGERTCGDGPDAESAWGISDKAVLLGLTKMLGIE